MASRLSANGCSKHGNLDVCLQGPSLTRKASPPPRAWDRRTQTTG